MAPTILAGLFVWFAKGKGQNSSGPATKNFASGQRTVSATFKPDFDPRTPHRRGQPRASSAAPAEAAHRAREMRAEMRNDPQPAAPGLFLLAAAAFFANLVILAIGKLADSFCQFAA